MTGHAERKESHCEGLHSSAESIQKPFTREQLLRPVRRALDTAPAQVEVHRQ